MIGLLQRVKSASVLVSGEVIGRIDQGILVFVGIRKTDTRANADRLLKRLLEYRVFADAQGKMNLSTRDVQGGLLLVPQFTLVADTNSGTRASFTAGARPGEARILFDYLLQAARANYSPTQSGEFGSDMQVTLTNDGPVTFLLEG